MPIKYENAPIIEALIDIRVELPLDTTLERLEGLHIQLREQYPIKNKHAHVVGQFSVGDEVEASATRTQTGFVFSSEDGAFRVQARLDGFTFSSLRRPYGTWSELRDEARRLWEIYRSVAGPSKITRVAVRYVNQICIPELVFDYKDYFRTTPEVSPDLPQGLSGFFMQLIFPQEDFGGVLILTQAAVPPVTPNTNSVILDLDVYKQGEISENETWDLLETLRMRKNRFFEGSLTEKARALFGQRKEY